MIHSFELRVAVCVVSARILMAITTCGQTWQTVQDYIYNTEAQARAVATDATSIYVAGTGLRGMGIHAVLMRSTNSGGSWAISDDIQFGRVNGFESVHVDGRGYVFGLVTGDVGWYARRSTNSGATWETVDTLNPPSRSSGYSYSPKSLASDSLGRLYAVGTLYTNNLTGHWFVRRSDDAGDSWQTVANLERQGSVKGAVCVGTNLYLAGNSNDFPVAWQVRKSSDGGVTWTLVDTFHPDPAVSAVPAAIAADSAGNLYVAGQSRVTAEISTWTVRKGNPDGSGWVTIDEWDPGFNRAPLGVGVTPAGDVFVIGYVYDASGKYRWTTRRLSASTGLWSTSDTFDFGPGGNSTGYALAADSFGNVYAVGNGSSGGGDHWLVRKLAGPLVLALRVESASVVLTWLTNYAGFSLERTQRLSPADWKTIETGALLSNDKWVVTVPVFESEGYFRLRQ